MLESAAAALAPTGYSGARWRGCVGAGARPAGSDRRRRPHAGQGGVRHGLKSMLFAPELSLARAWTAAARGDGPGAIDAAREAAGPPNAAVSRPSRCGRCSTRCASVTSRAADAIERLDVDCAVGPMALSYARALTAGDAAALDECRGRLQRIGMHGVASARCRRRRRGAASATAPATALAWVPSSEGGCAWVSSDAFVATWSRARETFGRARLGIGEPVRPERAVAPAADDGGVGRTGRGVDGRGQPRPIWRANAKHREVFAQLAIA